MRYTGTPLGPKKSTRVPMGVPTKSRSNQEKRQGCTGVPVYLNKKGLPA
jgi:hypothetical protein